MVSALVLGHPVLLLVLLIADNASIRIVLLVAFNFEINSEK